jgi:DNA-binding NtrC family response regulator
MLRLLMPPRQSKPFIALFPDSPSSRSNPEVAPRKPTSRKARRRQKPLRRTNEHRVGDPLRNGDLLHRRTWLPHRPPPTEPKNEIELPRKLLAQEKSLIEAALKETRGRVFGPKEAAAKLGIPRSTLESKIRSLKIDKNRLKTYPGT